MASGQAAEFRFDDSRHASDGLTMRSSSLDEIAERGRLAHGLQARGSKVSEIAVLLGCNHWRVCQALNFHGVWHRQAVDTERLGGSALERPQAPDEP